jgi:hypothetical protein
MVCPLIEVNRPSMSRRGKGVLPVVPRRYPRQYRAVDQRSAVLKRIVSIVLVSKVQRQIDCVCHRLIDPQPVQVCGQSLERAHGPLRLAIDENDKGPPIALSSRILEVHRCPASPVLRLEASQ